jgi:regulator of replication initiation timing
MATELDTAIAEFKSAQLDLLRMRLQDLRDQVRIINEDRARLTEENRRLRLDNQLAHQHALQMEMAATKSAELSWPSPTEPCKYCSHGAA